MKTQKTLSSIFILVIMFISVFTTINIPVTQAATIGLKTYNPPKFGIDVGPAIFHFASNKISWVSGTSNTTLALPSLTIAVATTNCAIAQSATFTHNMTHYHWHFSGASACNGQALTTTMDVYIKNTTSYNIKKFYGTVTTVRAGPTASITNKVLWTLSSNQPPSNCNQINCNIQCFGNTCFDWSAFPSFSYNNSTKTVTAISGSSTASITTFTFDPLAIDGHISKGCPSSSSACTTSSWSTTNSNDIIWVQTGIGDGYTVSTVTSSPSLTWHERKSLSLPASLDGDCASVCTLDTWYAIDSSVFSSGTVSVTPTGTATVTIETFGISGANTCSGCSPLFDSNGAVPCTGTSTSNPVSCSISTSNANDIILGDSAKAQFSIGCTAGTGFTNVQAGQAAVAPGLCQEYDIVSTTQSGLSVSETLTGFHNCSANYPCGMIGDAILACCAYSASVSQTYLYSQSLNQGITNTLSNTYLYSQSLPTISLGATELHTFSYSQTLTSVNLGVTVSEKIEIDTTNQTSQSSTLEINSNFKNEIIIINVEIGEKNFCSTGATVASITGASITWIKRLQTAFLCVGNGDYEDTEEWYGLAPNPLNKALITFTFTAGATDVLLTSEIAIKHGNYQNPFDGNGCSNIGTAPSHSVSCLITTSNKYDMLISGTMENHFGSPLPTGWNYVITFGSCLPGCYNVGAVSNNITKSILTNYNITWGAHAFGSDWAMVTDSINSAPYGYSHNIKQDLGISISNTFLYSQSLAKSLSNTLSNTFNYIQSLSGIFGCGIFVSCGGGGSVTIITDIGLLIFLALVATYIGMNRRNMK